MANTIVKMKRKYTILPVDTKMTEIFIKLKIPLPEWILTSDREIILVVNRRAQEFYHDGVVRRLRWIFGKYVKVISVDDEGDFIHLI